MKIEIDISYKKGEQLRTIGFILGIDTTEVVKLAVEKFLAVYKDGEDFQKAIETWRERAFGGDRRCDEIIRTCLIGLIADNSLDTQKIMAEAAEVRDSGTSWDSEVEP